MRREGIFVKAAAGLVFLALTTGPGDAPGNAAGIVESGTPGIAAAETGVRYQNDYFDNFYAVASVDPSTLWAVGNNGRVIHSPDGGNTWRVQATPAGENLNSVSFVDHRNGWAGGNGGTVLRTADGGNRWHLQKTGTTIPIFRIQFLTEKVGYACGYFGLFLRTTDGGNTWEDQSIGEDVTLRGMHFLDARTGFIVGEFGTILRTDDGGTSFTRIASPVPLTLFAVHFLDRKTGYASGVDGTVIATVDGGRTWRKEDSGVKDHLIGLDASGGEVVAVGLRGSVTARRKSRWVPADSGTHNWLSGVLFVGAGHGFAVGAHGTILRLEDILGKGGGR